MRATVRVDWRRAPKGTTTVPITVTGRGHRSWCDAVVRQPRLPRRGGAGSSRPNGYVSMEAEHYTANVGTADVAWRRIPDIGRTGAGMTPFPVTAAQPGAAAPARGWSTG